MTITFSEWDGRWPGNNVGHVDGAGASCDVLADGRRVGSLDHKSGADFSVTLGEYPDEKYFGLSSRKRSTAQKAAAKIAEEFLKTHDT